MTAMDQALKAYNLESSDLKIEKIHNGLINSTWCIKNSHRSYILQKINQKVFKNPKAIASNISLIDGYLSHKYPTYIFTSPIKTKRNTEMVEVDGSAYRLFPFIEGCCTINTVEKPVQAFEAAKKFGEFTKILSQFPVKKLRYTIPDFHNLSLRYQQFTDTLDNGNRVRLKQSAELIQFMQDNESIVKIYDNIVGDPHFLLRVTHHDTKISNVLFDKVDKGLCVIDLDTVMPGYFISDVGDMIRTYVSPVNEEEKDFSKICIREDYFKAIWEGYMDQMKDELSKEEKDHFIYAGKFMIYMQAIRFITDYLNNDIYYGSRYEGQNFVRAENQMILFKKLIEKETSLKRLIINL